MMRKIAGLIASIYFISCGQSSRYSEATNSDVKELFSPYYKEATRLPENDEANIVATIDYKMRGCFGGDTCKLVIIDLNGQRSAILKSQSGRWITELDSNKMQSYEQFVHELKTVEFGALCTIQTTYTVQTKQEKLERTDGGCSWNGFYVLSNALFPGWLNNY